MTGYVRKDTTNNIADGNVINAADLDAEFDGVQDAFNASTGHKHDGTAGEGATINALGPTQDVTISATLLAPKTTNTVDIGSSALKFKDLFLAGNGSIGGTLAVTGVATFTAQPILSSLTASRAVFSDGSKGLVSNAITGTGNVVMSASPTLTGTIDAAALTASGNVTLSGGTANGVAYLNGSKVVTTGSALVFDGTNFGVGGTGDPFGRFYGRSIGLTSASSAFFELNAATGSTSGIDFGANATRTAGITSNATETNFTTLGATPLLFGINSSEQMRLTSTGLGIGTSSPVGKLDVAKTSNDTISRTNASGVFGDYSSLGAGLLMQQTLSSPYGFALQAANAANSVQFPLLLNPSGGNVGIGTSSPAYKLQVDGASTAGFVTPIVAKNPSTNAASGSKIAFDGGGTVWGEVGAAYNSNDPYMAFFVRAGSEKMRITDAGNLGLGVTPSAWDSGFKVIQLGGGAYLGQYNNNAVQVGLNTYFNGTNYIYTTTNEASRFVQTDGQFQWFNAPSGTAGNAITFTQAMTLDASGNLMVGTTTATGKASIAGAITATASSALVNPSVGVFGLYTGGAIPNTYVQMPSGGSIDFWKADTGVAARIDSSGNMGLGVTPSAWATYTALQIKNGSVANYSPTQDMRISSNAYYNAGWKYVASAYATQYLLDGSNGSHQWFTAPSGTAGNAITFTQAMTLDNTGALLVGSTANDWGSFGGISQFKKDQNSPSLLTVTNQNSGSSGSAGILLAAYGNSWVNSIGTTAKDTNSLTWALDASASPPSEKMRLTTAGNLLVGTTTAAGASRLVVATTTAVDATITVKAEAANYASIINIEAQNDNGAIYNYIASNTTGVTQHWKISGGAATNTMAFSTGGSERARILSNGVLLVGTSSAYNSDSTTQISGNPSSNQVLSARHSGASPNGLYIIYSGASPNNTGNYFGLFVDSSTTRFELRSNGGIANYQANDANLSDRREKTNFAPAGSYLEKICAIPVQTFNYIDQNMEEDGGLTLGVVAQDVQAVAPELVMESNWAKKDEAPKMRLSIYQTDLQYALMKALQELKAEFDAYKASHP